MFRMFPPRLPVAVLLALAAALPAAAAPAKAPAKAAAAQSAACANAMSQSEMTDCAAQDSSKADAALNASYARLMKNLSVPSKARLKTAQRAWIAFRDSECLFESNGADGGSVAPMIRANCMRALSTARAKALDALGNCAEGDLSCPR